jgi:hypothetical protein
MARIIAILALNRAQIQVLIPARIRDQTLAPTLARIRDQTLDLTRVQDVEWDYPRLVVDVFRLKKGRPIGSPFLISPINLGMFSSLTPALTDQLTAIPLI